MWFCDNSFGYSCKYAAVYWKYFALNNKLVHSLSGRIGLTRTLPEKQIILCKVLACGWLRRLIVENFYWWEHQEVLPLQGWPNQPDIRNWSQASESSIIAVYQVLLPRVTNHVHSSFDIGTSKVCLKGKSKSK